MTAGLAVLWGCSDAAKDRLERWLFDVPPTSEAKPDETTRSDRAGAVSPEPTRAMAARLASVHRPFAERKCAECHDESRQVQPRGDLLDACKSCHARYFSEEVGHAPVSQGECRMCHDMHQSTWASLLRREVVELCIDCHEPPEELSAPAHKVANARECAACHDAHFGKEKLLKSGLRAGAGDRAAPRPDVGQVGE